MAKPRKRTPQPPIDRLARSDEGRRWFLGILAAVVGAILAVGGAVVLHRPDTQAPAALSSEFKLIKAASECPT